MARAITEQAADANRENHERRKAIDTRSQITNQQRQIFEAAMAKKIRNDAASKTRSTSKGKYYRRAQRRLAARSAAYARMDNAAKESMAAPGSMKLRS